MDILFPSLMEGIFLKRPNRFLAAVMVEDREEAAHVPNSGRMKELFIPGAKVWLTRAEQLGRKTAYTLKLIEKDGQIIAIDTILANDLVEQGIKKGKIPALEGVTAWKREFRHGQSRFDFYLEAKKEKIWLEVKSVNLVENQLALFPDAPTARGARHVRELLALKEQGERAVIIFVVMREDALSLRPYLQQDPDFARALQEAAQGGVEIYAFTSEVNLKGAGIGAAIPVEIK